MTELQISIISHEDIQELDQDPAQRFSVNQHARDGKKVIEKIEALEGVWDLVVSKLTGLAAKSQVAAAASHYELSEIEFNIGIEAGLSIGLVTKGNASVSITFSRKKDGE